MQVYSTFRPFFCCLAASAAFFLFPACKNAGSGQGTPQATSYQFARNWCVNDRLCANFSLYLPQVTGYDSLLGRRIEKRVELEIAEFVGAPRLGAFESEIDSAGTLFLDRFIQYQREHPESEEMWMKQVLTSFPVVRPDVISIVLTFIEAEAGMPPRNYIHLFSIDLTGATSDIGLAGLTGKPDELQAFIERSVKAALGLSPSADLAGRLLPGMSTVPAPRNIAIVPEGIRVVYNAGEIMPPKEGAIDLLLTWDKLGDLVDRDKWLDE